MVDLPTPDEPSRTTVRPGLEVRREGVEPVARGWRWTVSTGASPAMARTSATRAGEVVAQVGLVEQHHRGRAARPGERQVAFQAPQVEVVGERGDDDHACPRWPR